MNGAKMANAVIILGAGLGTRMNSDLPKVLHPIAGAPMLVHAMQAAMVLDPLRCVVVAGYEAAQVQKAALAHDPDVTVVVQAEQLGTGHAVAQAQAALADFVGDALVLYGDTPFIRPDTLEAMIEARQTHDIVVLGFEAEEPARYGRLILKGGQLDRIVEYKDATDDERAVTLCNSGVIAADAATLFDLVAAIGNDNAAGEYYLTDIIAIARARGLTATAV
jgi:bifunctional UDP-N-acetylglucosamine pyrophosphorylase / glucosamine-1-phosphate N-acetyltransferase